MSICSRDILVGPYCDGELSASKAAEMQAHLAGCAECAAHLADLEKISSRIAAVPLQPILPIEQFALHRAIDRVQAQSGERMILRFASSLAAVAAIVLLVTSLCLTTNILSGSPAGAKSMEPMTPNDLGAGPAPRGGGAGSGANSSADQDNTDLSTWMVRSLGGQTP
jgi:anti-sigma factor RsiW